MIRAAIVLTLVFAVLTGLVFPLIVTGIAQAAFPAQANGSLVRANGQVVGSSLIGQPFVAPGAFHPRPSAAGNGYDPTNSGGTNLGPTSEKLLLGAKDGSFDGIKQLAEKYRRENGLPASAVLPADAVTRSASGLDPQISVENAMLQAGRVSRVRGIPLTQVQSLIREHTAAPFLGIFGSPCVNVLELNRSLGR